MKESKYNLVYKITNLKNGNIYIGVHKTNNINDGYMGSGKLIRRAISKEGLLNFSKEILYNFNNYEEVLLKEVEIVNEDFVSRKDTYNIVTGGCGGSVFHKLEKETQDKIRANQSKTL